jgi:hypothetical protein
MVGHGACNKAVPGHTKNLYVELLLKFRSTLHPAFLMMVNAPNFEQQEQ